jgi:hypothetical protein
MDVLVGPRVPIAASNRYVEGSRPSMSGLLLRSPDPTLWERFLEDPGRLPADDPVVARWARVRALGVSPEGQEPVVLEASHLAEHKEQLACLLEAAYPLLWDAAREFSRRDYTLLLADAEGVIVERFGGGAFEAVARQSRLVEGATWHEAVRGTNAIGTAVAEGASVAVEGCAPLGAGEPRALLLRQPHPRSAGPPGGGGGRHLLLGHRGGLRAPRGLHPGPRDRGAAPLAGLRGVRGPLDHATCLAARHPAGVPHRAGPHGAGGQRGRSVLAGRAPAARAGAEGRLRGGGGGSPPGSTWPSAR